MLHMTKNIPPPTSKPARVSVPVSAEVLVAFQRLAKAGNMSTGRAMAEWLADTLDAADYMATTLERARAAPKIVAAEMHAYALGLADETGEVMRRVRTMGSAGIGYGDATAAQARAGAGVGGGPAPIPPSCNTGGKVPPASGKKNQKGVS